MLCFFSFFQIDNMRLIKLIFAFQTARKLTDESVNKHESMCQCVDSCLILG
jgi:hypothetical protein